ELPPEKFNSYTEDSGLELAIERRRERREEDRPGRETYGRAVKTLVRPRAPAESDGALITAPLGLRLEIVPEADPNALPEGAPLPVRVEYEGRPLAGATVRVGGLDASMGGEKVRTDEAGRAAVALPHVGAWVLAVVWTKPLDNNPAADYDTTF